ncbi:MAG TPA: hypothetical protein DC017_06020 [Candidatus Wallbacteria bacterium]|nr:hypothetical protein [Candidatus Wallbacteria bacterium]
MNKFKEAYNKINENAAKFSWNEKALVLGIIFIVLPAIYMYLIYPWQADMIKKADREYKQSRQRHDRLAQQQSACEEMRSEMGRGEELMKFINALVMSPDDAIQIINIISELIVKNALSINFLKNSAQFERIYEKIHRPSTSDAEADQAAKFSYKVLPIEFAFRCQPIDFFAFLNIVEGFKNLNFNIKRMSASRSNDGQVDVNIIVEIIVELNLYTAKNS